MPEWSLTLLLVTGGAVLLGVVSGALGSVAYLRRQSLLGDVLSHAALPGLVLAFLLTGSRNPAILLLGAGLAAWLAALCAWVVVRLTPIKTDTALAVMLAVFFGAGLMLLTFAQKFPGASQAGLERFLFGQAATLLKSDILLMGAAGAAGLLALALFWKEMKLLCFDPDFGASLGFDPRRLNLLVTTLITVAIVIGLQTVGVVLMAAFLVAPPAAARQCTHRFSRMVVIAAVIGGVAGGAGALLSCTVERLPTGPVIVLLLTAAAMIALAFGPAQGLVWAAVRHARQRRSLGASRILLELAELARQHPDAEHPHDERVLVALGPGAGAVRARLRELEQRGWARQPARGQWLLTSAGREEAGRLLREAPGGQP